jgi:hypothetical protein
MERNDVASPSTQGNDAPRVPMPVVLWNDIFVLVDQGNAVASDYPNLQRLVLEQGKKHPGGLGGLVIIPAAASPPPEEVRRAIRDVLTQVTPQLRCLCWLVEGTGFRAAAVRAALIGLGVFSRHRYATHVAIDMTDAVGWILKKLEQYEPRQSDLDIALEAIQRGRRTASAGSSESTMR